jgi:hypothetical protein
MKIHSLIPVWAAAVTLVVTSSCTLSDPRFQPVTAAQQSHLGVSVQAPGIDGWQVHEEREANKWFVLFKTTDPGDSKRTQYVALRAARFTPTEKKVFERDVGLQKFAEGMLKDGRAHTDKRFRELDSEIVPETVHGIKSIRGVMVWEERNNPHFPGAVLRMDNSYYFFFEPMNTRVMLIVHASTREPIDDIRLSADPLARSFIESMMFY